MSVQIFEKKSKRKKDVAPATGATIYGTPWTAPSIRIGWEVITPKKPEAPKQEQQPSLFKPAEQTEQPTAKQPESTEQPSLFAGEGLRISVNEPVKVRFVLRTDRPLEKDEALPITSVKLKVDGVEKDITWNINWVRQDPSTGEFVGEYKITFDKPGEHSIQLGIQYILLKGMPLNPEKPAYRSPLIWSDPVNINVSESKEGEKVVELSIKGELPRITTAQATTQTTAQATGTQATTPMPTAQATTTQVKGLTKTSIPPPRYRPPDPRWFEETINIAKEILRRYGEKPYVIIYGDGVYVGNSWNDVVQFVSGSPRLGEVDVVANPWDAIPHRIQFNTDLNQIIKGLEDIMNETKNDSVRNALDLALRFLKDMASWPEAYYKTNYMYHIKSRVSYAAKTETDPELKKRLEYYADVLNNLKAERIPTA